MHVTGMEDKFVVGESGRIPEKAGGRVHYFNCRTRLLGRDMTNGSEHGGVDGASVEQQTTYDFL